MSDDSYLRAKVRDMMEAGKFPNRPPDNIWGGPGSGASCAICDAALERRGVELEIQFIGDDRPGPGTHRVHVACFSIFEFERQNFSHKTVSLRPQAGNASPLVDGQRRQSGA